MSPLKQLLRHIESLAVYAGRPYKYCETCHRATGQGTETDHAYKKDMTELDYRDDP